MDLLLPGVAAAFLLAGTVKGISGMGLPTVAIALLGVVMPPAAAAALLVVPSLATNVMQCLGPYLRRTVATLWPMWLGIVLGALFTPFPKLASGAASARIGLGVVLLVYSAYGLARPAMRLRLSAGWMLAVAFLVGCVTGVMAAATGVFFFPMVVFLQSLEMDKDELVQALGISFTVSTVALAASLGFRTSWQAAWSAPGLLAIVFAFAGMAVGTRLRRRTPAAAFRKVLFIVFAILGAVMIGQELA
ncbi:MULTISPECIES: sulfite exporter TauE/SafE family protein [Ramlibacter]|jgi:uncharacterized membrane protein YfcA|uniref:Probable membrane transporter protein n=1 Tax=Ramlibacter pinisoli TaxID=2682844 RepID=A0A6N8J019_9BURK|nr:MULTISPECIES: sulfite exporter TauE/SafE family protein [Ramlibacter]MBA2961650.1 sulfite exporter TauE/SafE family protein [Ramlibacter sp. CGMCC 1.13660]MVQ31593.1 TSUP family transporter [Ramlibacter pinisoli]